jgi:hypothetical protein
LRDEPCCIMDGNAFRVIEIEGARHVRSIAATA